MGRLFAVEVVYRGIFQKTLSKRITRAIVWQRIKKASSASPLGAMATARSARHSAKAFAIVATTILRSKGHGKYEPKKWT